MNRALQLSEAGRANLPGGIQLDLSELYEGLADAYLAQASGLVSGKPGSDDWRQRKEAYGSAVKYFAMAVQNPLGFAPADARLFTRLADACEAQAQMDSQELAGATPGQLTALIPERDELWRKSDQSIDRAREILIAGNVASSDPDYRTVMLERGNIIFGREVGASDDEKAGYYHQALSRFQDAAELFPDDPRPFLFQGLCYERLTGMKQSSEEKQKQFRLGEAAFRKALTLRITSPDYSPAMPYHGLAMLFTYVNDYTSVLECLKKAQQTDPVYAESAHVNQQIQTVEQYLASQERSR